MQIKNRMRPSIRQRMRVTMRITSWLHYMVLTRGVVNLDTTWQKLQPSGIKPSWYTACIKSLINCGHAKYSSCGGYLINTTQPRFRSSTPPEYDIPGVDTTQLL